MKWFVAVLMSVPVAGCGVPGILPLQPNLNFDIAVPPLPAVLVDLDGRWVLSGTDGSRACLVIQESRVSILDLTCSSDGRGVVARITRAPVITRAGSTITLSVSYNPQAFDAAESSLSFSGTLQIDGSFIGTRRDEQIGSSDGPSTTPAVLSRA
jgi:hypothetical protein